VAVVEGLGLALVALVAEDDGAGGDGAARRLPRAEGCAVAAVLVGDVGVDVAEVVDLDAVGGEGDKGGLGGREVEAEAALGSEDKVCGADGNGAVGLGAQPPVGKGLGDGDEAGGLAAASEAEAGGVVGGVGGGELGAEVDPTIMVCDGGQRPKLGALGVASVEQ